MKKIVFLLGIGLLALQSCDEIDNPFEEKNINTDCGTLPNPFETGNHPTSRMQKVFLEDYTGHKCPNCPQAATTAEQLKGMYGSQLVVMAVHTGPFSALDVPHGFVYDFTTDAGDEFNNFFNFFGYPSGLVNRRDYTGSGFDHIKLHTDWAAEVAGLVNDSAMADIQIITNYVASSRQLCMDIRTTFFENLSGDYYLGVYLIEDSIVQPQVDNLTTVTDYVHNHVLREAVNSTWGEEIITGSVAADSADYRRYSITLDPEYSASHCSVVAMLYRDSNKEVIQSEYEHITP